MASAPLIPRPRRSARPALSAASTALAALASRRRRCSHLSDADLARGAEALAVPLACICAVIEVESRGCGFLRDARPVILFERHVFWQRLEAHGIDPGPHAAQLPELVSRRPGGYEGGAAEHRRLARASRIDAAAACESASWGAFQVMGYHWERLGYPDIQAFVACMERDEAAHLDAFVRFVMTDRKLLAALQARDWADFARGYNGPEYARNRYDVKLERAYYEYANAEAALE
jgi:hypothetical protein